ncbi:hypothetical protein F4819DRAFT_55335 [Hypoxylon fuscum]|nr:hypothetical protein F4819DRAFT_55335 [Hypoxylon fuscum]
MGGQTTMPCILYSTFLAVLDSLACYCEEVRRCRLVLFNGTREEERPEPNRTTSGDTLPLKHACCGRAADRGFFRLAAVPRYWGPGYGMAHSLGRRGRSGAWSSLENHTSTLVIGGRWALSEFRINPPYRLASWPGRKALGLIGPKESWLV